MYLIFAGFWLVVAVAIFVWQWQHPELQQAQGSWVPYYGWLALLFSFFQAVRWFFSRRRRAVGERPPSEQ